MMKALRIGALLALLTPAVQAALQPEDYRRLNDALVAEHVAPRYAALADATAALDAAAVSFCAERSMDGLPSLRASYEKALDVWQGIQHVRFGPIELFMRGTRIAFWPDSRNSVTRQIEELLAARDPADITAQAFGHGSAAAQGFPALERLLYGAEAEKALLAAHDTFRCELVVAIGKNLASIAAGLRDDWTVGDAAYARVIDRAGGSGDRYRAPEEATLDLFKALYATVELVADHKLARPLGASAAAAKPRLAESWRSQRSLDNIRRNLEAGEAMYLAAGGFSDFVRTVAGDADLDALLRRAFAQIRATSESVPVLLEAGVADPAARPALEQLLKETSALKALLAQRLTAALGIPLGFNALDGD